MEKIVQCEYGENAWQKPARLVFHDTKDPLALQNFKRIEGGALGYNNWCDVDRLLQTITHIAAASDLNRGWVPHVAVAVKHGNPCGAAMANSAKDALQKVARGDKLALFGGMVMTNFPIIEAGAHILRTEGMSEGNQRPLDGVLAPAFSDGARMMLNRKNGKCRLLTNPALIKLEMSSLDTSPRARAVRGGHLEQSNYTFVFDFNY